MADAALGFLLLNLTSLMRREASFFQGLKIKEIQLELESMLSFLKDADRRKIRETDDDRVQITWVGQVREITYKVEDIIDKYMYHIAELRLRADKGLLQRTLVKTVLLPKRYYHKRKIASELQAIMSEIQEISERYKRYCLPEVGSTSNTNDDGGGESCQHLRQQARLIPDVDIVGIEESKNFLIKRLTESDQVLERVVLSVVGMGGLGKTTLVTKVYNHPKVKNHFDCYAWITVSQTYKVDELLRNLMKELCKSTNEPIPNGVAEMDPIEISEMLISYLQTKRLWVAQGFIQERRGLTLEEAATDYIKDLVCRGMLQFGEIDHRFRKKVRMHDVLRELAISIGHKESFCYINDGKEETLNKKARYLSMGNSVVNIGPSNCHLRSLMLFKIEIPSLSLRGILSSFKLLRVLDLEDSPVESLPDELVEIFNLRYLSLRNTNVEELPESIGRLQNLQTLDIRTSKINILPKGVEKLKKLRHILTYHYVGKLNYAKFAQAPTGICNLKFLQTLEVIGANNEIVKKIGNLTQLRRLTIAKVERDHGVELCASLQKIESLGLLNVIATREEEIINMEALSSPPTHLERLGLIGRLERLPLWIVSLQKLTGVYLDSSQLNEDPLYSLQALPNLMKLYLRKAYVGTELCFRCGHFLQLKILYIERLTQLNQIKFEEGSMSCIQLLFLFDCPNLKTIEGIRYLTSLQRLVLTEVSGELLGKIRGDEWVNFQHIPRLFNFNSTKGAYERLHQIFHTQVPSGAEDYQGRTEERMEMYIPRFW